jgi:hypothetical protein
VRSHHPGGKKTGKSAPRIAYQIAKSLPPSAKVPVSQSLSTFEAAASRGCFRLGSEVLTRHRRKLFAAGGFGTDLYGFFFCVDF